MPVIQINNVVDPKKNNRKKWRAKEEERHLSPLKKTFHSLDIGSK
jgi:hypothetical protein